MISYVCTKHNILYEHARKNLKGVEFEPTHLPIHHVDVKMKEFWCSSSFLAVESLVGSTAPKLMGLGLIAKGFYKVVTLLQVLHKLKK